MTKGRRGMHKELHQQHQQRSHHHHHHSQRDDDDFIPLPIQTFLWRQTNPFVRPFLGKARDLAQIEQRDACKLFERIIITNNNWGQSPSLTDAIASIDRWRLIKVSFPFVLQCTASLLNNKLIKDHNFNRLGGNEAKMMYTLQWILMNAFEECADSETEAKNKATSVALAAASLLKPSTAAAAAAAALATSGTNYDDATGASSANDGAARLGSTSSCVANQSIILPVAAAAAVAIGQPVGIANLQQIQHQQQQQQQQNNNSSSSVSPIGSSTPTKQSIGVLVQQQQQTTTTTTTTAAAPQSSSIITSDNNLNQQQQQQTSQHQLISSLANQYLLPISSIQMFVYYFAPIMDGLKHSDFLTSNQRLEIGAALWEPLFNHLMPDIHCLKAQIIQTSSSSSLLSLSSSSLLLSSPTIIPCNQSRDNQQSQKQQQSSIKQENINNEVKTNNKQTSEILTTTTTTQNNTFFATTTTTGAKLTTEQQHQQVAAPLAVPDRRRSSSIAPEPSHYGDVFLGGPTPPTTAPVVASGGGSVQTAPHQPVTTTLIKESTSSTSAAVTAAATTPAVISVHLELAERLTRQQSRATYLDIAVLRCLFIGDWQESGVYWAMNYLSNRFNEEFYITNRRKSTTGTSSPPNKLAAHRDKLKLKLLARRRSKSLACLTGEDFRRSLTLKREQFKQSRNQQQRQGTTTLSSIITTSNNQQATTTTTSTEIRIAREDFSYGDNDLNVPDGSSGAGAQSGRSYLRVEDASCDEDQPRSPVRRLSFSSGMQTLANQIRKTSKRVKKSSGGSSTTNEQQQQQQQQQQQRSSLSRTRRSSSADDLSSGQLSALSLLQRDTGNGGCNSNMAAANQRLISAESQPMITVMSTTGKKQTTSGGAGGKKATKKQAQSSIEQQQQQTASIELEGNNNEQQTSLDSIKDEQQTSDNKQYLMQALYLRSLKHLDKLTRSQTLPRNMHFSPFSSNQTGGATSGVNQTNSTTKSDTLGANYYVDEQGRMDPLVLLKVLHSISQRETACSLRVCDRVLYLLIKLINIGILDEAYTMQRRSSQQGKDLRMLLPSLLNASNASSKVGGGSSTAAAAAASIRTELIHKILIDIVFRLQHHLGCPNQCGLESTIVHHFTSGQRQRLMTTGANNNTTPNTTTMTSDFASTSKLLRAQLRETLDYLQHFNGNNFVHYIKDVLTDRPLKQVIDLMHSLLGFCRPDYYLNNLRPCGGATGSGVAPVNPTQVNGGAATAADRDSKLLESQTTTTIAMSTVQFALMESDSRKQTGTLLNEPETVAAIGSTSGTTCRARLVSVSALRSSNRKSAAAAAAKLGRRDHSLDQTMSNVVTLENIILNNSFKQLITRMVPMGKELKFQENSSLYFDIRRLIGFIREHYNATFRSLVLSALIDCTKLLNEQQKLVASVDQSAAAAAAASGQKLAGSSSTQRPQVVNNNNNHHHHYNQQQQQSVETQNRSMVAMSDDESLSRALDGGDESVVVLDTATAAAAVTGAESSSAAHRTSFGSQKGQHQQQQQQSPPTPTGARLPSSKLAQLTGGGGGGGINRPMSPMSQQESSGGGGGILSLSKAKRKLEQVFGGSKSTTSTPMSSGSQRQTAAADESTGGSGQAGGCYQTSGTTEQTEASAATTTTESRQTSMHQHHHQSISSLHHHHQQQQQQQQQPVYFLSVPNMGPHLSIKLIKQNQLIYSAVHLGMSNFSFLMESCLPGDFLDPALLAALLDLKGPIAIRAAVFFECANFVHRCNRGQWPSWMRMQHQQQQQQQLQQQQLQQQHQQQSSTPHAGGGGGAGQFYQASGQAHHGHRGSNAGLLQSTATSASRYRKSSSIQRTARNNTLMYRSAGRAFYAWAEAVGARLEELLQQEEEEQQQQLERENYLCNFCLTNNCGCSRGDGDNQSGQPQPQPPCTNNGYNQASLSPPHNCNSTVFLANGIDPTTGAYENAGDLLQSSIGNESSSPFVLKMAACQLLFEVTTFLRETFRYLPPTIVQHHQFIGAGAGGVGGKTGDKMSSIYDVSRAVTANRRWSMALSSLGFGQLPATLSALSSGSCSSSNTGGLNASTAVTSGGVSARQPAVTTTTAPIPEQPERRISFILHETRDEEEAAAAEELANTANDRHQLQTGHLRDNSSQVSNNSSTQGATGLTMAELQQQAAGGAGSTNRHLSQSSASSAVVVAAATLLRSSGVLDSQSSHRRKSIKLKKPSDKEKDKERERQREENRRQAKFAATQQQQQQQDLDEETAENSSISDIGLRRTDSMRSKRRVSGISERSDTSDTAAAAAAARLNECYQQQQQQQAADLSAGEEAAAAAAAASGTNNVTAAAAAAVAPTATSTHQNETQATAAAAPPTGELYMGGAGSKYCTEMDEVKIMSNMPWFRAISMLNARIDCNCTHFPSCRPNCYKLHQNNCRRLVSFVQTIYEDPTEQLSYMSSVCERQLADLMSSEQSKKYANNRAGSDCSNQNENANTFGGGGGGGKLNKKKKNKHNQSADSTGGGGGGASSGKSPTYKNRDTLFQNTNNNNNNTKSANFNDSVMSSIMNDSMNALRAAKANERSLEEAPIIKYLRFNVKSLLHCPMSAFLKGAIILAREHFLEMIKFSWNLLLEDDQQLSRTAAVCFIISAIKCPQEASKLLIDELESGDASKKLAAINKFYVVWDARYQCWPRLEDGAFVHFKMAPPSIEFTLPSPKIAQESSSVVDPPWMPRKTSNVEEVTIGQDQTVQKSFVTATKTRRKQQIELVTKALREKHDKLREDREKYHITSVPVTLYAAFEPALGGGGVGAGGVVGTAGGDELDGTGAVSSTMAAGGVSAATMAGVGAVGVGGGGGGINVGVGSVAGGAGASATTATGGGGGIDDDGQQENRALLQMKTAQALFPTCLCQAAIVLINLLDDPRVTYEGSAVYEVASKSIWACLVEDPALFLRYFFERLTRQNQSTIFQVLRRLIRFMPRLPPQAAFTLYNYLIGFIIYYIRCPFENSQKLIADTLSVLCLVVPSVHGLFLKDLKQILRKEQCDHNLLITANVPSAKKIIVHGSDSSGIPSQFPIDESTQFYHILLDSLEFFGVEKEKQNEYFLIDVRTNIMHNLHSYVRDHYSFKRSQHPQLQMINMDPTKAFDILQRQELINQFMEFGKVLMSLSIVKSSHMAVQRVLFLHEELMKLPTFPRKALETNFSLFRGPLGHQVFSMDRIHKICWVQVIGRMFELTSGFFLQLGDIQLFLNAISGIFVLHCEEASVSRLCLATFINATHQFKSIFATDGFMTIMATIVQVYSSHQNNQLLCRSIEFVCKQFYIMHRKPFLLQLFGSVASRLNTAEILQQNFQNSSPIGWNHQQFQFTSSCSPMMATTTTNTITTQTNNNQQQQQQNQQQLISQQVPIDPSRISPGAFFKLLQSLEKSFKDPLDILELVDAEKPLRAIDFCYQQDKESIDILDIISLCVTVTAYASDSPRSTQMLIILESVVPLYMKHLQASTSKKAGQSMGKQAHKDELQKIHSISICIRTLIVNCEGLTRNFSGPLPAFDFRSSSIRRPTTSAGGANATGNRSNKASSSSPKAADIYNDEHSYTGPEPVQQPPAPSSGGLKSTSGQRGGGATKQATFAQGGGGGSGLTRGGRGGGAAGSSATGGAGGASGGAAQPAAYSMEENEITRGEFIVPRDTLLNLVAEFLSLSTGRLIESAKKYVDLHQKHSSYELLDVKSHLRLAEVANSLLKFASTDPSVMACRGLIRYMNEILPNTEWRQEAIRPALIMILKRLDKTFNRIAKKNWVRRSTDWEAAKQLLKGAYLTFIKHPYIVHLPHLKSLISCCQNIILNDGGLHTSATLASNLFHGFTTSAAALSQQQQQAATSSSGPPSSDNNNNAEQGATKSSNLLAVVGGAGSSAAAAAAAASATTTIGQAEAGGASGSPSFRQSPSTAAADQAHHNQNQLTTTTAPMAAASGGGSNLSIGGGGGGAACAPSPGGQQSTKTTPSLVALTAAAALAERLAAGSAAVAANSSSSLQTNSQGFNSVTIRLIAMQLLQTGDSQTLESFIGNSMNTAEKLESLMLNLIYPMCIRVCSGAREAPKLRPCDIMYILNIVLGMLAPQSASSKSCSSMANSPKLNSQGDTSAQFILSKITNTIGSTQTGATALGIVSGSTAHHSATGGTHHPIAQHNESQKIGFLGLKILCVCFEPQLATEWIRISRLIRDLAMAPNQPSGALWDFLDFVATYRFPMFILLLPTIRCQLAKRIKQHKKQQQHLDTTPTTTTTSGDNLAHYEQCLRLIEAKIRGPTQTVCRSRSFLFVSLTAELRMLKEQLIAKKRQLLEGERNQQNWSSASAAANSQFAPTGPTGQGGQLQGNNNAGGSGGSYNQSGTGLGGGGGGESSGGGDHQFTAYHRLSAAIASFASAQGAAGGGGGQSKNGSQMLGTSAALKGAACFAAQLATSTPIAASLAAGAPEEQSRDTSSTKMESSQSSIRLSTARSREEARRVMSTILRRTSYPHNQQQQNQAATAAAISGDLVDSASATTSTNQPPGTSTEQQQQTSSSTSKTTQQQQQPAAACHHQIIMDPAMLLAAAFPAPKKPPVESSGNPGILKQLVQTIDRQNVEKSRQQQKQGEKLPTSGHSHDTPSSSGTRH